MGLIQECIRDLGLILMLIDYTQHVAWQKEMLDHDVRSSPNHRKQDKTHSDSTMFQKWKEKNRYLSITITVIPLSLLCSYQLLTMHDVTNPLAGINQFDQNIVTASLFSCRPKHLFYFIVFPFKLSNLLFIKSSTIPQ